MFCTNCGEENADDSTFCRKCGKPLEPSNKISEEKNKVINDNENITSVASTEDKKSGAKKGGILIGVCCLGIILIGLFVGFNMPDNNLIERPLIVDANGHHLVTANVSENYGVAGVHTLKEQISEDNYEIVKGLNLTNKTDLKLFNTVVELCKMGSPSTYNGVPYYKVDSTQKLENRMFNIYGGMKVETVNTYIAYTYNNETKLAVFVLGTGATHVPETLSHVNFY